MHVNVLQGLNQLFIPDVGNDEDPPRAEQLPSKGLQAAFFFCLIKIKPSGRSNKSWSPGQKMYLQSNFILFTCLNLQKVTSSCRLGRPDHAESICWQQQSWVYLWVLAATKTKAEPSVACLQESADDTWLGELQQTPHIYLLSLRILPFGPVRSQKIKCWNCVNIICTNNLDLFIKVLEIKPPLNV